ncbi:hypothetical protein DFP94_1011226 [Fontibacillus phaseoli]|uniref:Uncharacterized protein n=1 Tax=Fontibacillus phaseoli TaxID=1416533 RepID=A0A369BRE4_9BACL|nr:hypothetical protein DFP94_1011226 [Fontibacillus phaseoli]
MKAVCLEASGICLNVKLKKQRLRGIDINPLCNYYSYSKKEKGDSHDDQLAIFRCHSCFVPA